MTVNHHGIVGLPCALSRPQPGGFEIVPQLTIKVGLRNVIYSEKTISEAF